MAAVAGYVLLHDNRVAKVHVDVATSTIGRPLQDRFCNADAALYHAQRVSVIKIWNPHTGMLHGSGHAPNDPSVKFRPRRDTCGAAIPFRIRLVALVGPSVYTNDGQLCVTRAKSTDGQHRLTVLMHENEPLIITVDDEVMYGNEKQRWLLIDCNTNCIDRALIPLNDTLRQDAYDAVQRALDVTVTATQIHPSSSPSATPSSRTTTPSVPCH